MEIVRDPRAMNGLSRAASRVGERVAFVPTMGWLHDGHLSLVAAARLRSERIVLSLFVNPTQFGPGEDFAAYPRDFERDRRLAAGAGVDWLFAPDAAALYPPGSRTFVEVEGLGDQLCGRSRPGHFRGVATVVAKLCAIVDPDVALFGEKDFQQLVLLQRMARDLQLRTEVVGCPIVREADGLAMSSRNIYLSPDERLAAAVIPRSLAAVQKAHARGERSRSRLQALLASAIAGEPLARLDYAEIVDCETLAPLDDVPPRARAVVAVWVGRTRLIDNVRLEDAAAAAATRSPSC